MKRTPLIAGNWKMFNTPDQSEALTASLLRLVDEVLPNGGVDVVICPTFPSLSTVKSTLDGMPSRNSIGLGAQNCYWEMEGAFTGEVSAEMVRATGCDYVILGHSERRTYFGETDETVSKKIMAASRAALKPIVCVGETLAQREKGDAVRVVCDQVSASFLGVNAAMASLAALAYEPVWAIGTGKTASPDDAQEMHTAIRGLWKSLYGEPAAETVRVLYGGSVNDKNALDLLSREDIDGALVGGASLKSDAFMSIVRAAWKAKHS